MPTVATQIDRAQLRWMGHVARADEERTARVLLGALRAEPGRAGKGNRGDTLLGNFGKSGTILTKMRKHLDMDAKRKYFDGRRGDWYIMAQDKNRWRKFVNAVTA